MNPPAAVTSTSHGSNRIPAAWRKLGPLRAPSLFDAADHSRCNNSHPLKPLNVCIGAEAGAVTRGRYCSHPRPFLFKAVNPARAA